jgi:5,10-methylenetetrahydromethanopterin reductase
MTYLGLVLHHGIEDGPQLARYGQIAEHFEYDALWVTERYFHEETFSMLGFLAASTERIRLGVGVVNPYTRPPGLLAMGAATLDRLSEGRIALGLGRSEREVIQGALGIPYGRSQEQLHEAVVTTRRLLEGESVGVVHLSFAPQQRRLPIYVAAIGRRALRLAGKIADGVVLNAYVPPAYVGWAIGEIHDGARDAGRDPDAVNIACMLVVRLTERPEEFRPQLRKRLASVLAEAHVGEVLLEQGGFDTSILSLLRERTSTSDLAGAAELINDDLIDAFMLLGSAEHCRERIEEYRAVGVDEPLLLPRLSDYERVAEALAP